MRIKKYKNRDDYPHLCFLQCLGFRSLNSTFLSMRFWSGGFNMGQHTNGFFPSKAPGLNAKNSIAHPETQSLVFAPGQKRTQRPTPVLTKTMPRFVTSARTYFVVGAFRPIPQRPNLEMSIQQNCFRAMFRMNVEWKRGAAFCLGAWHWVEGIPNTISKQSKKNPTCSCKGKIIPDAHTQFFYSYCFKSDY